jgi:hypothetical protein
MTGTNANHADDRILTALKNVKDAYSLAITNTQMHDSYLN